MPSTFPSHRVRCGTNRRNYAACSNLVSWMQLPKMKQQNRKHRAQLTIAMKAVSWASAKVDRILLVVQQEDSPLYFAAIFLSPSFRCSLEPPRRSLKSERVLKRQALSLWPMQEAQRELFMRFCRLSQGFEKSCECAGWSSQSCWDCIEIPCY